MLHLLPLLRGLIAPGIARLRRGLFDLGGALILLVMAGFMGMLGLAFLLFGLYQSLLQSLEPWIAAGIVAFAALLACFLFLLRARRRLLRAGHSPPRPVREQPAHDASGQLGEATEQGIRAGAQVRHRITPVDLALAAFIAGLIASKVFREDGRKDRKPADQ